MGTTVDSFARLGSQSAARGAATHSRRHLTAATPQHPQQVIRRPSVQLRLAFSQQSHSGFPDVLRDVREIEYNQGVIPVPPEQLAQDLELRLIAIHQRHPTLATFRITQSRLPERLLDHLLGGLLHAGPNALAFWWERRSDPPPHMPAPSHSYSCANCQVSSCRLLSRRGTPSPTALPLGQDLKAGTIV